MRKSSWIVAAIAAVACGVLLWAWFAPAPLFLGTILLEASFLL